MSQHTPDHDRTRDNRGDDAGARAVRLTRSSTQDTWHVERIDTEPMTAQQYDRAISTLAALIGQWQRTQENANDPHEEAA